jgi:hypothetical protein
MSEFGSFPQREQKCQYCNENEYNRGLTVHQCLRQSVMDKENIKSGRRVKYSEHCNGA